MQLQPTLKGKLVTVRPIQLNDFEDLFHAASDPKIWEQHPSSDRYKKDVFMQLFNGAIESQGGFVIIDNVTDYIIGSTRFYDFNTEKREVIIGYTFLAKEYWGLGFNREVKQLLLGHAFEYVDTVLFEIGKTNYRSQKAIEKIGATLYAEKTLDESPHLIYRIEKKDFKKITT